MSYWTTLPMDIVNLIVETTYDAKKIHNDNLKAVHSELQQRIDYENVLNDLLSNVLHPTETGSFILKRMSGMPWINWYSQNQITVDESIMYNDRISNYVHRINQVEEH
tara:strand:- start:159 stop:482 length:324 start_codon:yes stop_codon:yes gene_type:complete